MGFLPYDFGSFKKWCLLGSSLLQIVLVQQQEEEDWEVNMANQPPRLGRRLTRQETMNKNSESSTKPNNKNNSPKPKPPFKPAKDDTKPVLQDPILRSDPIEMEEVVLRLGYQFGGLIQLGLEDASLFIFVMQWVAEARQWSLVVVEGSILLLRCREDHSVKGYTSDRSIRRIEGISG
ncbi:hypothetical protein V8G54_015311 [Vigna mungo]|uniref:Uncharacterized protein n=1 Tax=Vigna mungo TaxID=3915 RepID=A0AAQ3NJ44_VIGMU